VIAVAGGKYQMTMSVLEIDAHSGAFRLFSAGGLPGLVLPGTGGATRVVAKPGSLLGTAAFAAGVADGRLEPGDRLLLMTDGIPEMIKLDGRPLGMRELAKIYEGTRGQELKVAVRGIVEQSDLRRGKAPQEDDWTLALIAYGEGARPA
jgi:serine phosphatase RsbU (regulator of sigma subunit)